MRRWPITCLLALAALVPAGCGGDAGAFMPAPPLREPKEGDLAVNPNDPCVLNLGAMIENLIVLYSSRRTLPPALNQLPGISVTGQKIGLTCPETGKPYVYVPQGIHPPSDLGPTAPWLILYDAEPAHHIVRHFEVGNQQYDLKQQVRYGIVMRPAPQGQPVAMYVVPVDDALLKAYLATQQSGQ